MEALVVGDPADEDDRRRPGDRRRARRTRILEWIEEARAAGAEVLAGGEERDGLIRPTVIANAAPELKVSCDEVFGPVVTVNPVDSLDEAIELANGDALRPPGRDLHERDPRRRCAPARELEFGGVTVNEAPTFRTDQMPYGGVKDSGNTREGPAVRRARADRRAPGRPPASELGMIGRRSRSS